MSTSVTNAFIKQFEREVHEAYQRQGSKLRDTVRVKNNVQGAATTFQKVSSGTASTKTRHGDVPVMNLTHTAVEATLADYYAGDWVDKLDELKLNIDERQVIANAGAYALGRKTDEIILTALGDATTGSGLNAVGLTKEKIFETIGVLNYYDVPDDGQRFAVIGEKQYRELLAISEFASADYVGVENLPFNTGAQAKNWLGITWIQMNGLPLDGGSGERTCYMYHRNAVGFASGADIQTDVTWHGDKAAHFVSSMMSAGAALIDNAGVCKMICDETPA